MAFETSIKVRFGDTDPYGVLYFASYFKYAHQALEDYLRERGIPPEGLFKDPERNLGMPVVAAGGNFKHPIRYGEEVTIKVHPARQGRSSITFHVEFWLGGKLCGNVDLVLVAINREWAPRPLPLELQALGEH